MSDAEIHRIRYDKPATAEMCLAMCASHKPSSVVVSIITDEGQFTYHTEMPTDLLAFHAMCIQKYLLERF